MRESRERRDEQPLHAERRPVALRVLEQLVGLRDPDRLASPAQPVVEDDGGGLAALAGAGPVTEHEAAPEAHGVGRIVGGSGDKVEGLVHRPGAGEIFAVGLAGIDHRLELGVRQHAIGDEAGGQTRPIAGLGRCDRGHRRGLHQLGRMGLRAGNTDRLEAILLVDRLAQASALGRRPIGRLIGEIDGLGVGDRRLGRPRCDRTRARAAHEPRRGRRGDRDRRGPFYGQTGRRVFPDPPQQRRDIGRYARGFRECARIVGRRLVDDGQPRFDRRAMPGVDAAVDGGAEHDPTALL